MAKRLAPLARVAPDPRFDHLPRRLALVARYWLAQWKQPRYMVAGILHIVIFAGFLVLSIRSVSLVIAGIAGGVGNSGSAMAGYYGVAKDYVATLVFIAVVAAAVRRTIFRPARYAVPSRFGKDHTREALLVLGLIALLMLSESLFEASTNASESAGGQVTAMLAPFTLAWAFRYVIATFSYSLLNAVYLGSYLVHDLTFFAFLCFLPMGKHFHVITSLFNVYFAKVDKPVLKPVRYGTSDEQIEKLTRFGVKSFDDFTWKHVLDFYSCADCGRCSDNCPANAVGRPLSPRFLTIKGRDYSFRAHPLFGKATNGTPLVGSVYSEEEIWSCTTCGACEEECPLMVEYIDKIVDMRRGLIDEGKVPQSIQKPLKALESRGNPYGKTEKKRADWTKAKEFQQKCPVRVLDAGEHAETLYFVDSITSYDDRIQQIGRATARILSHVGEDFGVLGALEKDSGHDVRRFGEEMLYIALRDQNIEAIKASGATRIVTADPHAYNALRNDYRDVPPVEHLTQVMARKIRAGNVRFKAIEDGQQIFTYHDPCYLGRHNRVYDEPREVLDAIPGLKRVEMKRCRDRSFCCGGGGLMLFYEAKEEQRMGVQRVRMAADAGANVVVTACPFCMVNIEDAIKVAGLEGKMTAIDIAELVDRQIVREDGPGAEREARAMVTQGD